MDKWKTIQEDYEAEDVYIGTTTALQYALQYDEYFDGVQSEKYVSLLFVVNSSGCDKKMLSIFGTDSLAPVKSVPVKYYLCNYPIVALTTLDRFLSDWNTSLISENRYITFLVNLPRKSLSTNDYSQIKIHYLQYDSYNSVNIQIQKIIKCFKYYYRKAQIIKNIVNRKAVIKFEILDYINIMIAAWHNVSSNYIHHLFYPYEEGRPNIDKEDRNLSLVNWCIRNNVPVNLQSGCRTLDEFISVDDKLDSLNINNTINLYNNEMISDGVESTSGIDAYQAMKRLLSYLQCEGDQNTMLKSAKLLDAHLQLGATKEIHEIAATTARESNFE